jgi:endonuclease/exonuclease/phosphatase family metal-dependent hydrolase
MTTPSATTDPTPVPTVRVVQLNAGTLLEHGWDDRRHEIVAWLRRLDPDVVCLQEIWERIDDRGTNTAGWIAAELAEQRWFHHFGGGAFDESLWPDANVHFGSSILSRWPIDDAHHWPLPVAPDALDPFPSQVPWELVHARTAGLDVFSCHLASAPVHAHHRRRQVLAIDELIRSVRGDLDGSTGTRRPRTAVPAILCGDFNAEPDSDEIRFLTSLCDLEGRRTYYQDAWRVAGDGSPGWTQQWRTHPIADALNVPRKRIDYVFVGDPFHRVGSAGRVLDAQLAFHESITGVMASDHIGLVVDIVWPERPERPGSD